MTTPNVLVSFEGFQNTPELATRLEHKAAKLHRHHAAHVGSLHLHLRHETPHSGPAHFVACATVKGGTREIVVHADGAEPEPTVNDVFAKLERSLADVAGERKHARHETG